MLTNSFTFFRRLYAHPGSAHCPVALTLKYFQFLGGHQGSVVPQCSPANRNVPHASRVLSYTHASDDLQYTLRLVGVDPKGFTEHSMKRGDDLCNFDQNKIIWNGLFAGGATEAARCGATREEIQVAGHWASARTVEKYIEASQVRQRAFNRYFAPEEGPNES